VTGKRGTKSGTLSPSGTPREARPFAFNTEGQGFDESAFADRSGTVRGVFVTTPDPDVTLYIEDAQIVRRVVHPVRPSFPPYSRQRRELVRQFRVEHPELRSGRAQWEAYAALMKNEPTRPYLSSRDFAGTSAKPGRLAVRRPRR
jgi:hypothetical protein